RAPATRSIRPLRSRQATASRSLAHRSARSRRSSSSKRKKGAGMRFVTFEPKPAIERFGVLLGDGGILDCEAGVAAALAREVPADRARALAHAMAPPNAQDFIANGRIALDAARRALQFAEEESRAGRALAGPRGETIAFALGEVKLLAPVPRPRKFIAAGKNYFEHQDEMGHRADAARDQASRLRGRDRGRHRPLRLARAARERTRLCLRLYRLQRPLRPRPLSRRGAFGRRRRASRQEFRRLRALGPLSLHAGRDRRSASARPQEPRQRPDAAELDRAADDVQDRRADRA